MTAEEASLIEIRVKLSGKRIGDRTTFWILFKYRKQKDDLIQCSVVLVVFFYLLYIERIGSVLDEREVYDHYQQPIGRKKVR